MLVGGTALAGFYAGHRRSDDLDLFVGSPAAQAGIVAGMELILRPIRDRFFHDFLPLSV